MKTLKRKSRVTWTSLLALAVALVAVAALGCGSDTDAQDNILSDGSLGLTQADNGKSFTVSVGDTIRVTIAGNPTTGYQWESDLTEQSATLLTLAGEPAYVADAVAEDVVGSGGTYTFTFIAADPGQAELKLKYWRSFEPEAEPAETFAANITIE